MTPLYIVLVGILVDDILTFVDQARHAFASFASGGSPKRVQTLGEPFSLRLGLFQVKSK